MGQPTDTLESTHTVEKPATQDIEASRDPSTSPKHLFSRLNAHLTSLSGFEARGLERVPPSSRQKTSTLHMLMLWFSANLTVNNLSVPMLGPLLMGLGFTDCAWCMTIGVVLGSISTAYMSTRGPVSGCRTMVVLRFFMGYHVAKLCSLLNVVLMVGWGTIDCILAGQMLAAVSGGSMSVVVGVVIVAILEGLIAGFGLKLFYAYERFAWLPQAFALFVLVGCAGPNFNASLESTVSGSALAAARLTFVTLCFYVPNSWAAAGADFYVYYPENTPKWKVFTLTVAGLILAFMFVNLLGIGLACGVMASSAWQYAYNISAGALIVESFAPLGGFGKFCSVVLALGVIANCVPGSYSAAICSQTLGRYFAKIPRWAWVVFLVIIQLVLGVAGRNKLFVILQNFLALMGYWLMPMIAIVLQEHLLFKTTKEIDWTVWSQPRRLPSGFAALAAFLLGWTGAILGMYQTWFVGPLAKAAESSDVGMWIGTGFTLVAYPPLRYTELKLCSR
ncbi:hypothetical protein M409DRAFT_24537 [Zasmidium cellare ATCC 36951]|uniref:Uncharacterized protein n=1 Tax=Zasmidium cellare ATCC 36951 TaxID=1080233 RepID=A0A6A6CG56_ZASCE|nr:uncharacterized protein M409DRAFT_24537 [Zasmidium cellare ATCC 36951]KAF2165148.1 hypothetical protein M409DRAFT_24537 [Zasmidium cellare ATCC 36951]